MFGWSRSSTIASVTALALTAGAAMAPATAHAAIESSATKIGNAKAFAIADTCRGSALLAPAGPDFGGERASEAGAPSALSRVRMSQERPAATLGAVPAPGNSIAVRALTRGADPVFGADRADAVSIRVECTTPLAAMERGLADDSSELGTIAIPVETTRFDDRWLRVRRAPSVRVMRAQLDRAAVTQDLSEEATLERVNQWVNRQIAYADDESNYRQRDFWATAEETVARGRGDCEDFAILKMQMLRAAGIDDDRMKLVLLRDMAVSSDHALLLVRSAAGWVVLDNMTDRILDGRQAIAMRPMMSFSGDRRWVHGYRDTGAGVVRTAAAAPKASAKAFSLAALRVAMQPAAPSQPRYLRNFDASIGN